MSKVFNNYNLLQYLEADVTAMPTLRIATAVIGSQPCGGHISGGAAARSATGA
jgi:hypothetical protein